MVDFRLQNLTSLDVRFWRLKTVPGWKGQSIIMNMSRIYFDDLPNSKQLHTERD